MSETYTRVKDITVNITTAIALGSVGLGMPLVITGKAADAKPYTVCSKLSEVIDAGFDTTTDVYKACELMLAQENKPAKFAVCACTEKVAEWVAANEDKGYRQVIAVLGADDSTVAELATAVTAAENKMLFVTVTSTTEMPVTQSDKVVCIVYNGESSHVEAALVGATAGLKTGSFTYKNVKLVGVAAEDLGVAAVETIHTAGGMCILKKAGDVVTSEGKTTSGEYIDVIDSKDFVITNIAYRAQKLLNDSQKLTFDNVGISQLENTVTDVLADAYANGIIATNEDGTPAYSTLFTTREHSTEAERTARNYTGGNFRFDLAGAIHTATINGTLVI